MTAAKATPLTDAHAASEVNQGSAMAYVRAIDFAKELERTNAALAAEVEQWRKLADDKTAVRVNLLRGTIARPDDIIFMHDTQGPYAALAEALSGLLAVVDPLSQMNNLAERIKFYDRLRPAIDNARAALAKGEG